MDGRYCLALSLSSNCTGKNMSLDAVQVTPGMQQWEKYINYYMTSRVYDFSIISAAISVKAFLIRVKPFQVM